MGRHKGFVVGSDIIGPEGKTVWKVRVKDMFSALNSQKLVVASVHGEIQLAQGLNVNFAVGTVDDEKGNKVIRAVDVRLEVPDAKPSTVSRSGGNDVSEG